MPVSQEDVLSVTRLLTVAGWAGHICEASSYIMRRNSESSSSPYEYVDMFTIVLLSIAAAAQGQYPYPPAVPAIRVPITRVVQPEASGSGRLQASHFRSGPYPPALPSIQGGDISPIEQESPRVDHPTYSLPPYLSSSRQPEQYKSSPASPYPKSPNQLDFQPGQFRSAPVSSPSQYSIQYPKTVGPSSYPTQSYPVTPNQVPPTAYYPPYPARSGQPPSPGTQRPELFQSGGEVSPEELEIPPNSQIKLQDKRLQYSHGFSDDKGTAVKEQGSLLSTNDGWEYVIAKKGSYSYISPEGKMISVNYIADDKGFRIIP